MFTMYLSTLIVVSLSSLSLALPSSSTSTLDARNSEPQKPLPVCKNKSPQPPNTICGSNRDGSGVGHVLKPAILRNVTTSPTSIEPSRPDICLDLCGQDPKCKSASYSPGSYKSDCTLYTKTVAAQRFVQNNSDPRLFWDRACFTCTYDCAGDFTNGDFETGSFTPWWPFSTNDVFSSITSPGYNSLHMADFSFPGTNRSGGAFVQLRQPVNWCLNKSYDISFAYQMTDKSPTALTVIIGGNNDGTFAFQAVTPPPGEWVTYNTTYTPKKNTAGQLEFDIESSYQEPLVNDTTWYIDEVVVKLRE